MFLGNRGVLVEQIVPKNYWGFCLILLTKQEKGAVNSSRQTWYAGRIDEF